MAARTTPRERRTDDVVGGAAPTIPSPAPARDTSPQSEPHFLRQLVVWVGIATALTAAVALVVLGGDSGTSPEQAAETATATGVAPDPTAGREVFLEDLRSVGRIDPVAGRKTYFDDLRSIGISPTERWRTVYLEDLRSVGRIDPVAGREIYMNDLRSVGR